MKKTFVTLDEVREIVKTYPTPFHLYDERGIRENAKRVYDAFSWNPGFREYFAVKATPNPFLLNILHEEGCGCDCSSMTELMLSEACGITGEEIMFSSNDTPVEEYRKAADQSVTVSENGKVYIKEVKETPVAATLRIEKVRAGTSTKLAGAKYEILASDGKTKAKDIYGNTLPDKTTMCRCSKSTSRCDP